MSHRQKYSNNGVIVIERFGEHVETRDFEEYQLGTAAIREWRLRFRFERHGRKRVIYPYIEPSIGNLLRLEYRYYLNVIKRDGTSAFTKEIGPKKYDYYDLRGNYMDVKQLLDEKNGYLWEGKLLIEYGIQIEKIRNGNIWELNFSDRMFDCFEKHNTIWFFNYEQNGFTKYTCCHLLLASFHSSFFHEKNRVIDVSFKQIDLRKCLHYVHGRRLCLDKDYDFFKIVKIAQRFSLFNVIRHCEQQLIESNSKTKMIGKAIDLKLNRYLAVLLKKLKTLEDLKKVLNDENIQKMSGEAMKTCAKLLVDK